MITGKDDWVVSVKGPEADFVLIFPANNDTMIVERPGKDPYHANVNDSENLWQTVAMTLIPSVESILPEYRDIEDED